MKISFNNVSYTYNKKDKPALKNINFVIDRNDIVFILGHTGSGKSTLVQHLNGLLFPKDGEVNVEIEGNNFNVNSKEKNIKELRKNVGLVFQFPENQLFESSVLKDVMFSPRNFGYKEEEAEKLAKESLELLGIGENYYQRSPFDLSGGEKRKVAIAGVIASKPKVLVLDEPTSSLDNKSTKEFFNLIKKLKNDGVLVIVVSHDVNLCYEYADKVMILNRGELKYFGSYDRAFLDKKLLKDANIETPFVLRVKEKLKLNSNARTVKDLVKELKEVTPNE